MLPKRNVASMSAPLILAAAAFWTTEVFVHGALGAGLVGTQT